MGIGVRALLVAIAAAAAPVFLVWCRAAKPVPPSAPIAVRAAAQSAVMSLESEPVVIRFGTPASEVHEVNGFEHVQVAPGVEPSAGLRRRAEMRLRWTDAARRVAVLDFDLPPTSPFRALRVLLNGHKVGRLDLSAGRHRYAIDLPAERQQTGGNILTFIFGAEAEPVPARARTPTVFDTTTRRPPMTVSPDQIRRLDSLRRADSLRRDSVRRRSGTDTIPSAARPPR